MLGVRVRTDARRQRVEVPLERAFSPQSRRAQALLHSAQQDTVRLPHLADLRAKLVVRAVHRQVLDEDGDVAQVEVGGHPPRQEDRTAGV